MLGVQQCQRLRDKAPPPVYIEETLADLHLMPVEAAKPCAGQRWPAKFSADVPSLAHGRD